MHAAHVCAVGASAVADVGGGRHTDCYTFVPGALRRHACSGHATEIAATPEPLAYARAALILWVNQAGTAQGGLPGVSVALVAALLAWVNDDDATPPRLDSMESTDPGFGALVVNCQLALHVLAERQMPCREGECLPLMSHNNLLLGRLAHIHGVLCCEPCFGQDCAYP